MTTRGFRRRSSSVSWVTTMVVRTAPLRSAAICGCVWCVALIRSWICTHISGSRPEVGSSYKISTGSITSARATATRLAMPPLSMSRLRCSTSSGSRPTSFSAFTANGNICSLVMARSSRGSMARLSNTSPVSRALRWKTTAQCMRTSSSLLSLAVPISSSGASPWPLVPDSWSATHTRPLSAMKWPVMCFSSTVLPQPEPPTMATISPRSMRRFTPSSTGLPSKALCRSSITTSGACVASVMRAA